MLSQVSYRAPQTCTATLNPVSTLFLGIGGMPWALHEVQEAPSAICLSPGLGADGTLLSGKLRGISSWTRLISSAKAAAPLAASYWLLPSLEERVAFVLPVEQSKKTIPLKVVFRNQ